MSEKITFWIALISFLVSMGTLAERIYSSRVKIRLSIIDWSFRGNSMQFFVFFENNSHLPISITRVRILLENDVEIDCKYEPVPIKNFRMSCAKGTQEECITMSMSIPVYLQPLGAVSGYLEFLNLLKIHLVEDMPVIFQISTNRGKSVQKLFLPPCGPYLLHNPDDTMFL